MSNSITPATTAQTRWQVAANQGAIPGQTVPSEEVDDEEDGSEYEYVTDDDEDDEELSDDGRETPNMDSMQAMAGYENVGFAVAGAVPPPSAAPPEITAEKPEEIFGQSDILSEAAAREALLKFVSAKRCWGSGLAKKMTITKVLPTSAFHYELQSFTERRHTSREHVPLPFNQKTVDGPDRGNPPQPWDFNIPPKHLFVDHNIVVEIPHTSTINTCHRCNGRGRVTCPRCSGSGRERCGRCHGSGRVGPSDRKRRCGNCGGRGRITCRRCRGDRRVDCPVCETRCKLRWYIQLTIEFTNHVSDYIKEDTDMPDELIRDVGGVLLFEQTLPSVWPLQKHTASDVNDNSKRLVEEHKVTWPEERIVHQYHSLRAVQVTEIHYRHKDGIKRFWVYGNDNEVYCPDYPSTCCWGCSIL